MNKGLQIFTALFACSILLSSCEAIGAIFKAGVWTGVFVVAIIIAIVIFIARGISKNK
jgi:hypothetical protein